MQVKHMHSNGINVSGETMHTQFYTQEGPQILESECEPLLCVWAG
jgi:hypothetical protein